LLQPILNGWARSWLKAGSARRPCGKQPRTRIFSQAFVMRDDATVKAFASASQLHPTNIAAAHQALNDPKWERDVP
jgi:hypothetical protein